MLQHGPEKVLDGCRYAVLPSAGSGAAQQGFQLDRCARGAIACTRRGRIGGDGGSAVAPQLLRADTMLFQDIARSLYPRQAIQQMFQSHVSAAVKQRSLICCIAAGQDRMINRDWPVMVQLR